MVSLQDHPDMTMKRVVFGLWLFPVFLVLSGGGFGAHGQEAEPPAPPKPDRAGASPQEKSPRPILSEREVEEYKDLARQLGEEIDRLIRRGLRDAADEVQRRFEQPGSEPQEETPARPRAEHLRQAAEHLAQAGMEADAARLRREADELMREESVRRPRPESGSLEKRLEHLEGVVQGLREEIRELRRLLERKPL